MAKTKLKRAPRIEVRLSSQDDDGKPVILELRAITAIDVSDLVKTFDLETVELTAKIINHVQGGKEVGELFTDASFYVDMMNTLPDLCSRALTLCAGGDEEDYEAIRELGVEDFALATAAMVNFSLERIGGLGNLIDLATEAARKMNEILQDQIEAHKNKGIASSSASGGKSPSSKPKVTRSRKPSQ